MKKLLLASAIALLSSSVYAQSFNPSAPTKVAATERGGTVTSGGAAQTIMVLNPSRKSWCVQNDPAASETLYVRVDGVASATTGTALAAGQQVCNQPGVLSLGAISVFGATTGHRFFATETQQ